MLQYIGINSRTATRKLFNVVSLIGVIESHSTLVKMNDVYVIYTIL